MAELLFTTTAFHSAGRAVPGVPMILDERSRLVEPACAWLLHIALVRGRTRSPQTWRTYGESLYDWWQTLEANGWQWDQVNALQLAAYRDHMLLSRSEHTKRAFSRSTINLRVRTVSQFYRWCSAMGLLQRVPLGTDELRVHHSRSSRMLAHLDAGDGRQSANDLTVRQRAELPRPLATSDLAALLRASSVRDRLIMEWGATTGLRRMEVAGLRVPELHATDRRAHDGLLLHVTKGGHPRRVYPPRPLIDRTLAYVREERGQAVRRARARTRAYNEPTELFLKPNGSPLNARAIGAMFATTARRTAVNARFHSLRHTFATTMLRALQRASASSPEMNPLLTLQVLLGHAELSTTAVYLRVIAADLSVIEASVDDLYSALQ